MDSAETWPGSSFIGARARLKSAKLLGRTFTNLVSPIQLDEERSTRAQGPLPMFGHGQHASLAAAAMFGCSGTQITLTAN